ncbi:MAG: DUF3810 family protein [Saprospiraceae bacterium]|nr:DUF3810 family protein [Candidatus Opimibacter iunctus]
MSFFKRNITSQSGPGKPAPPSYHKRSLVWTASAMLVLGLKEILPSAFWDHYYYQGLFGWIRQTYDFLLGWSPLPMVYIILAVILVRVARWIGQWRKGWIYQGTRALGGIAAMVTIFYMAWGFNYGQVSLQDRLGFRMTGASKDDIEKEFARATKILKEEAEALPDRLTRDEAILGLEINDRDLRPDVVEALSILDIPHDGKVRIRQLWPAGFLLRWSTAGIYIPQTGEGHIDKGLLSVQKPFTIAHEMAHGYGVTDEGACNFIAWLACSQSRDQWIRFGGALTYWRYTAAEMPNDSVSQVIHTFPPVVLRAITLVRANDKKYPDLMPRVRDAIYSSYLKSNGVRGGLRSYNEVVLMVEQYLKSGRPLRTLK